MFGKTKEPKPELGQWRVYQQGKIFFFSYVMYINGKNTWYDQDNYGYPSREAAEEQGRTFATIPLQERLQRSLPKVLVSEGRMSLITK